MSTSKWGHGDSATPEENSRIAKVLAERVSTGTLTKTGDYWLPDFRERVLAGFDLLDQINPGWQNEIDVTVLDLEDDQKCTLGQAWPLYAKTHGLLENGDYKQFADAVFNIGDKPEDRQDLAASIGCALNGEDIDILNSQLTTVDRVALGLGAKPAIMAAIWDKLTMTWITELVLAKVEGRWGPYTTDTLDESIKSIEEVHSQ